MTRTTAGAAVLAAIVLTASVADAVVVGCFSDPVVNTEEVLCAPPSGPCDGSTVVVGATLSVKNSDGEFDLGQAGALQLTVVARGR